MKIVKFGKHNDIDYRIVAKTIGVKDIRVKVKIYRTDFLFPVQVFERVYCHDFIEEAIEKAKNSYFNMDKNIKSFRTLF